MAELRKDPIVGRWVIVAANRAERPNAFAASPPHDPTESCPFCKGQETETPDEVYACREPETDPNHSGWRVRVVPNKFPALETEGEPHQRNDGMFDAIHGIGAHEVIIESPDHLISTSDLSVAQLAEVFGAYKQRLAHWKRDPRFVYGMVFKNVGTLAGASLEHTHSQLIVTPIVPISVWEEMTGALEFYHRRDRCPWCEMIGQEVADGQRVVQETPNFLAFSPYASRLPFETWVVPKTHASHYENIEKSHLDELADLMRSVVARIEISLDRPAYNYLIHTAPFDTMELRHYHWHIEVIPILTKTAGFEWGSGFYINPVPPEQAAALLRQVKLAENRKLF